jgi:hypothetical protein
MDTPTRKPALSEISDLVAIFGEVDRRLVDASQELREHVATLLPEYANPEVRWYDEFLEWTAELGRQRFPEVDEAMSGLAEDPLQGPRSYARRLLAITVLVRVAPEIRPHTTEINALARRALRDIIGPDENEDLLEFLADPDRDERFRTRAKRTPDEYWDALADVAVESNRLSRRDLIGDRPCTGSLIVVQTSLGEVTAVIVEAQFETGDIDFQQALGFLNPVNWTTGMGSFWCEVKELPVPPGSAFKRYHEVVSVDCPNRDTMWTVATDLDFYTDIGTTEAIVEYGLPPGHPRQGDDVYVDEGSLQVTLTDKGTIAVWTSKRVCFSHAFSGESLKLVICALGYRTALEELVERCKDGAPPSRASQPRGASQPKSPQGSLITEAIDRTAAWAKASIDECATAAADIANRMDEGCYGADDLVGDMAKSWLRLARVAAKGVDAAVGAHPRTPGGGA